jgi:putative transposase
MNSPTHPVSIVVRTVRLKVKPETAAWLNDAASEVNAVWNWANEVSAKAARPFVGKPKWLSGFQLNSLAGAQAARAAA